MTVGRRGCRKSAKGVHPEVDVARAVDGGQVLVGRSFGALCDVDVQGLGREPEVRLERVIHRAPVLGLTAHQVTFAGLAPGLLNVFQLDVQMPNTFQGSPSRLSCDIGYPSLGYVAAALFAVQ
jgi:hypothetical protein